MGLLKSDRPETSPRLMEKVARLMEDITRAGWLAVADGWELHSASARVKLSAGQFTVTDAPLPDPKEQGVWYAMFDVESIAEAIHWTKCFLQVLGEGECEIRPLFPDSDATLAVL
jgi:hypothetical protein